MITAADVDFPTSEDHLAKILRSFNLEAIVICLARINLLLQRSDDYLKCERILRKNFCSQYLREQIQRRNLTTHIMFNRLSTLRLLSMSVISLIGLPHGLQMAQKRRETTWRDVI